MRQFEVGERVRVPEGMLTVCGPEPRAGQEGEVLKVHDQVFLLAYLVRFDDGTCDTMNAHTVSPIN